MQRVAVLALLLLAVGACASVQRQPFQYLAPSTGEIGAGRTVLLFPVRESRPQVLLEDKPVSWVGDEKLAMAVPRDVLTGTGEAFATIVQETVRRDLEAAGFTVRVAGEPFPTDRAVVAERIREAGAERGLFVDLLEFAIRAGNRVDVHWNLFAEACTADGVVLAERRLEGYTTLEGGFVNPASAVAERVPLVFREVMSDLLLDDEQLMAALAD